MSRQLNLRLGREGPVQRYSLAKPPVPSVTAAVLATLRGDQSQAVRDQTLMDPTKVSQFACVWGTTIGFLTRPTVIEQRPNPPVVLASFSDHIGTCVPVMVPLAEF